MNSSQAFDNDDCKYPLYFEDAKNSKKPESSRASGCKDNPESTVHGIFDEIGSLILSVNNDAEKQISDYRGWKSFTDFLAEMIKKYHTPQSKSPFHFPVDIITVNKDINNIERLKDLNDYDRGLRANLLAFYGLIMPEFILPTLAIEYNNAQDAISFDHVVFSYAPCEIRTETIIINRNPHSQLLVWEKKQSGVPGDPLPDSRWA